MSATAAAHTAAYRQQSVLTASSGQLVVMLYDGCLRFLHQASYAMREDRRFVAVDRIGRAGAIIDELLGTLDLEQGGVIASRLQGIYVFCLRHLQEARLANDPAMVEKVAELLSELRDAWAQIATA